MLFFFFFFSPSSHILSYAISSSSSSSSSPTHSNRRPSLFNSSSSSFHLSSLTRRCSPSSTLNQPSSLLSNPTSHSFSSSNLATIRQVVPPCSSARPRMHDRGLLMTARSAKHNHTRVIRTLLRTICTAPRSAGHTSCTTGIGPVGRVWIRLT